jgi:DNA-binding NtrC family response regulator
VNVAPPPVLQRKVLMGNDGTVLRVLVVDDEPLIRSGIARCLDGRALVTTATTAEEALEEIGSNHYDLCMLDVYLPAMDGLTAMRKMKEISPNTKVAIMTGSYLNEAMKKQIKDEAYEFIEKPFTLSRIREVAEKVMIMGGKDHYQSSIGSQGVMDVQKES